ncbi:glucose-induced degradation protein 8-B homolog [Phlebotomus argentipes]|uniref:glucose-induced degradation protein 8-B homolog n=1 Tax=Phlebotomus argentipes TaxID=94469 RepID=UPI002892A553|nr:glucose-induced degradation protein 8-B homolog [Phlebotomus argentipes]
MSFNDNKNAENSATTLEEWMTRLNSYQIPQAEMNKMIMNYLVTEGFKEAAEKFQAEAGVEPTVELNSLDNRILIRDAVQNGRIQEATHLVNQLHPELLDNDRYLYFHLQQLHLIELIRAGKIEEALSFAQTQMSEAGENNPEVLSELERTLALLAFEKPQQCPFADLLEQSHRQKVASELNAAILKSENQEHTSPRIVYLLKLILWAQAELDKKNISYPKMRNLATASIVPKM